VGKSVVSKSAGVVLAAAESATDTAELTTELTDDTTEAAEDKACEMEAASVAAAVTAADSKELATDNTDEATLAADERSEPTDDVIALASEAIELVALPRSEVTVARMPPADDDDSAEVSVFVGVEVSVVVGVELSVVGVELSVGVAAVSEADVAVSVGVVVAPKSVLTRLVTSETTVFRRLPDVDVGELESVVGAVVGAEVAAGDAEFESEFDVLESVVDGFPTIVVATDASVAELTVLVVAAPVNKLAEMMDPARSREPKSLVVFRNGVMCRFTTRGK
jgi:hypothetical protein